MFFFSFSCPCLSAHSFHFTFYQIISKCSHQNFTCKKPCTQTTYEILSNGKAELNHLLIKLTFKPLVHVTRALYSTTVVDVITSIGGSVRNLFLSNIIESRKSWASKTNFCQKSSFCFQDIAQNPKFAAGIADFSSWIFRV